MAFLSLLHLVADGELLTETLAEQAMDYILSGQATPPQIAGFLVGIRMRGETREELLGFARAMRRHVIPVDAGLGGETLLDTCGTGGEASGTFNISTVTAFVVAGAGVHVAKHGNRSLSSQCGSADILEALGVNIDLSPAMVGASIRQIGIGFLFAPALHPAMRYAQSVRAELKMRTVFNLLGPLVNPAGAQTQLVGTPSEEAAEMMAWTLAELGCRRGFVVHGSDGLDEITTTGPTSVFFIDGGPLHRRVWTPDDFGLPIARPSDLIGGDRNRNAEIAHRILGGEPGPARDVVLANAAAGLLAAGHVETLREGVIAAAHSIDSGAARGKLDALVRYSSGVVA